MASAKYVVPAIPGESAQCTTYTDMIKARDPKYVPDPDFDFDSYFRELCETGEHQRKIAIYEHWLDEIEIAYQTLRSLAHQSFKRLHGM